MWYLPKTWSNQALIVYNRLGEIGAVKEENPPLEVGQGPALGPPMNTLPANSYRECLLVVMDSGPIT